MAIAGRVAIVPKGDWSADATYKRLDAVTHNNTLYFAKKDVPTGTETSNTEYWSKSVVGSAVTVDDALSPTSTNPVQNKVVTSNLTDLRKGTVANLLNPYLPTKTNNGVTCTNNGDGTYTLNGTATAEAEFALVNNRSELYKRIVGKNILFLNGGHKWSRDCRILFNVANSDYTKWGLERYDGDSFVVPSGYEKAVVGIYVKSGATINNLVVKPMITLDLDATNDDFVPYTGDTGRLNGDVAELKAQSVKKDNVVNNQTTTVAGFALDARQANPNIEGSLGAMIKAVSNKKVPSIAIENIFTGNPFIVIIGNSDLAKFSNTHWDPDNGGYQINDIQYTAGATVNVTVSTSLPAHSIVIIDVNTLNQDNIKVQGSCIRHNLTDNASNSSFSISFTGRSGSTVISTIRYMPLVIHLA